MNLSFKVVKTLGDTKSAFFVPNDFACQKLITCVTHEKNTFLVVEGFDNSRPVFAGISSEAFYHEHK